MPSYAPTPALRPWQSQPEGTFKRGFGTGFGAALGFGAITVVLSIIAAISGVAMMAIALGSATDPARAATRQVNTIWGKANAKNTLHAVDVTGAIEGAGSGTSFTATTYGYEVAAQIDALSKDDAAGLLLLMNTPGGTINGSRAIADAVTRYQQRTGHKVVAFVQGMSASGGMYAMAGADEIIADHGTQIGSIGVIMGPLSYYKDITALGSTILSSGVTTTGGITMEYLTEGRGKDFGNPFRPMTAEERQVYQRGLANEYEAFVNWVSQHREIPADTIRNDLGAHLYDVKTAIDKKLVDAQMGRDEAFRRAAELNSVNPDDTKVVKTVAPGFISALLGAEARVYGHAEPMTQGIATSELCTGVPTPVVFAGDVTKVCG